MEDLLKDVGEVLQAFEDGIFVRSTHFDNRPDWAVRLIKPLQSLAKLKTAYESAKTSGE